MRWDGCPRREFWVCQHFDEMKSTAEMMPDGTPGEPGLLCNLRVRRLKYPVEAIAQAAAKTLKNGTVEMNRSA